MRASPMIKLQEVTQEYIEDVDRRLDAAMERLSETALEVKAERDKYAAALVHIRACFSMRRSRSRQWAVHYINGVLNNRK